eukprot:TRINITY_DN61038_c0_g1_i1.p1 TRINITY_DN61038_c0_g1~~TRINITY_DN61038_c0_g1_i1.p1  ORF type:complete len:400 (+),score=38.32 TRINITY_DN61038_c0_g1_i1:71-1270(+)
MAEDETDPFGNISNDDRRRAMDIATGKVSFGDDRALRSSPCSSPMGHSLGLPPTSMSMPTLPGMPPSPGSPVSPPLQTPPSPQHFFSAPYIRETGCSSMPVLPGGRHGDRQVPVSAATDRGSFPLQSPPVQLGIGFTGGGSFPAQMPQVNASAVPEHRSFPANMGPTDSYRSLSPQVPEHGSFPAYTHPADNCRALSPQAYGMPPVGRSTSSPARSLSPAAHSPGAAVNGSPSWAWQQWHVAPQGDVGLSHSVPRASSPVRAAPVSVRTQSALGPSSSAPALAFYGASTARGGYADSSGNDHLGRFTASYSNDPRSPSGGAFSAGAAHGYAAGYTGGRWHGDIDSPQKFSHHRRLRARSSEPQQHLVAPPFAFRDPASVGYQPSSSKRDESMCFVCPVM